MTDPEHSRLVENTQDTAATKPKTGAAIAEFGPVVVFVLAYNVGKRYFGDETVFISTALFMVAVLVSLVWMWFTMRSVPKMALISAVIVGVFGSLTLLLRDPVFVKIKPTVINLLYGSVVLGSLVVRRNIWKMLFGEYYLLPDRVWNILALRWGLWFFVMAAVNEVVWRNFSETFWVNFKLWGVMPLTLIFALANLPLISGHGAGARPDR